MLVVYREQGRWEDRSFRELPQFIRPGDVLVVNNSRVFPSRLFGQRRGRSGRIEVFLLRSLGGSAWTALVRPGRKVPLGERIWFADDLVAEVVARREHGERTIR